MARIEFCRRRGMVAKDLMAEVGRLQVTTRWTAPLSVHKPSIEDVVPVSLELDRALRVWLKEYAEQVGRLEGEWRLFLARRPGASLSGGW